VGGGGADSSSKRPATASYTANEMAPAQALLEDRAEREEQLERRRVQLVTSGPADGLPTRAGSRSLVKALLVFEFRRCCSAPCEFRRTAHRHCSVTRRDIVSAQR
jgi:hypothetical protein